MNEYLSELVETTVSDLEKQTCILIEDDVDLIALNPAIIASYYNISTHHIDYLIKNLKSNHNLSEILMVVSHTYKDSLIWRESDLVLLDYLN